VSMVLKKNGEYPVRGYWNDKIKDLERTMINDQTD
jgi:hypothetical protein